MCFTGFGAHSQYCFCFISALISMFSAVIQFFFPLFPAPRFFGCASILYCIGWFELPQILTHNLTSLSCGSSCFLLPKPVATSCTYRYQTAVSEKFYTVQVKVYYSSAQMCQEIDFFLSHLSLYRIR